MNNLVRLTVSACALGATAGLLETHAIVFNPANGHYYEAIHHRLDWGDARAEAESLSHLGWAGHLATVTSAEENDFLVANLPDAVGAASWLGGSQPPNSSEPHLEWGWVTGEAWSYTNWGGGEPNDSGGEDALHYATALGTWNDLPIDNYTIGGYIVEFEGVSTPDAGGTVSLLALTSGLLMTIRRSRRS